MSRVISSGTRSSSSRSSTGQACAAARRAMAAWVRARSPKPWSSDVPVHSSAASHRCSGSSSSCTWSTSRTEPATSSSSSASTRSEMVTRAGRPAPPPPVGRGRTSSASSRRRNGARRSRPACLGGARRRRPRPGRAPRTRPRSVATRRTTPRRPGVVTRSSSSGSRADGSQRPSPGSNRPAPTSRSARTPASARSATVGCGRPPRRARASTGSASRTGSETVRDAVGELHRGVAGRVGGAHPGGARDGDAPRATGGLTPATVTGGADT